ncbi:hypothetical protein [Halopiger aswanensis]|uniref:Uncharacterized protein n=1 Tax=Halopiger aswanensis TaxID=148449 RepID=A0A3R7GH41_9EURY|nr:hypothetical protein [Halopiger aswanensis]RKD93702.1 hypothetical protein ATJ93_3334 [Halopiger aswanensis]
MGDKHDKIDIEVESPPADHLQKGWMPGADMRIHPGGIEDGEDRPWDDVSLPNEVFPDLLRCMAAILEDEECAAEFDMGELEFTPVPENDAVGVYFHIDELPRDVRNDAPELVDRTALVKEIYTTIRWWADEALSANDDLTDTDWFQPIDTALTEAEQVLEEEEIR